jgi:hypothetical protein
LKEARILCLWKQPVVALRAMPGTTLRPSGYTRLRHA